MKTTDLVLQNQTKTDTFFFVNCTLYMMLKRNRSIIKTLCKPPEHWAAWHAGSCLVATPM